MNADSRPGSETRSGHRKDHGEAINTDRSRPQEAGDAFGLNMDRTDSLDVQWFSAHPKVTTPQRPMSWYERETFARAYGLPSAFAVKGHTIVTRLGKWFLVKRFRVDGTLSNLEELVLPAEHLRQLQQQAGW